MRKSLVVIIAVAIIGAIGIYARGRQPAAGFSLNSGPSANQTGNGAMANDNSSNTAVDSAQTTAFKDGTYKGAAEDTAYGPVQISLVVSGGRITDVNFLQMPFDLGHSQEVTAAAEPLLKQTTLQKQSANIDFVSGATQTSEGYEQSLQSALNQAA